MKSEKEINGRIEDLKELIDLYKRLGYDNDNLLLIRAVKELEILEDWKTITGN